MPRRPVHPHLSLVIPNRAESPVRNLLFRLVILSGVNGRRSRAVTQSKDPYPANTVGGSNGSFDRCIVAPLRIPPVFISPHNNPVITQNLNILALRPQPCRRTLPRPRVPDKQTPRPVSPNDPATMQLNRLLLREPVHDQQFIKGIREGIHCMWKGREMLCAHLQ